MSSQEAKKQQNTDLLLAGVAPRSIVKIVGVAVSTVSTVKSRISNGEGMLRKQGSGALNKKRDKAFLKTLKSTISKRSNNFHEKTCQEYDS